MWINDTNNFFESINHLIYWKREVSVVGNDYRFIEIIVKTID